jgi:hypothetical protein
MDRCATVKSLFSSYIDKTINPQSRKILEDHLKICKKCDLILTNIRFLAGRLKKLPAIKTPENFEENLRSRIVANQKNKRIYSTNTFKSFSYGFSAAALLLVVYLFINPGSQSDSQQLISSPEIVPVKQSVSEASGGKNINEPHTNSGDEALTRTISDSTRKNAEEESRKVNLVDQ